MKTRSRFCKSVIAMAAILSLSTQSIFADNWTTSTSGKIISGSSTNVGIGTSNTGSKIQVNGNAAIGYSSSSTAPSNGLVVSGNIGVGTTTVGSKLQINGNTAIGYSLSTVAPTNGLIVSGQVGIGTITPSSNIKLDVNGVVKASSFTEDGIYNVKIYGAKGDGSTNDRASIQNAINAAMLAGRGIVYFPAGKYVIDSTLYIGTHIGTSESAKGCNISLKGQDKVVSLIIVKNGNNAFHFQGGSASAGCNPIDSLSINNKISDLTIYKPSISEGGVNGGTAINLDHACGIFVDNIDVFASGLQTRFAIGIEISKWNCKVNNVSIRDADRGFFVHSSDANSNTISQCIVRNCGYGIFVNAFAGNSIIYSDIEECDTTGIYVYADANGQTTGLNITGNYLEGNGKNQHNQLWINRPANGLARGILISGNYLNAQGVRVFGGSNDVQTPYEIVDNVAASRCTFICNTYYLTDPNGGISIRSEGVHVGVSPADNFDFTTGNIQVQGNLILNGVQQ